MEFLTKLVGDNKLLYYALIGVATLVVLLVVLIAYRLLFGRRLRLGAASGRSRQPRLGVVDAFDLDRQRQLVLLRRDNVEHLVMIGGPNDVVIEREIVRGQPIAARDAGDREAAGRGGSQAAGALPDQNRPGLRVVPAAVDAPRVASLPPEPPRAPAVYPTLPEQPPPRPVELAPQARPNLVQPAHNGAPPPLSPAEVPVAATLKPAAPTPTRASPTTPSRSIPGPPTPATPRQLNSPPRPSAGPAMPASPRPVGTSSAPPRPPTPPVPRPPNPFTRPAAAPTESQPSPKTPPQRDERGPASAPTPAPNPSAPAVPEPIAAADPFDSLEEEMAKLLGRPINPGSN